MKNHSYYFNVAILTPKIKFWLIGFSKVFKPRLRQTFAFRKSLSRFSNNLSLRTPVKILTLKKIKSKIFFKNFILNLLENNTWVSFSYIDVSNFELWNFTKLKKKIASFLNKYNFNYEIILTTKLTNKMFKNFIYKTSNNLKHPTYFSEKYFNTEKYSRSVSISNNLKILLLKFFSFFLTSNLAIKQAQILLNKKLNFNFLDNLLNYKNLFLSNWIFVFLKLESNFNDQTYFTFLNEIFNNIKLFECYSFYNGFITFYSNKKFNALIESNFLNQKDNNFINFFINYTSLTKKTILSFNNLESIKTTWKKKNMLNQLINTLLHLFSINFKLNLFLLIILLLQVRLNPFISKFLFFRFFLLKCQHLRN